MTRIAIWISMLSLCRFNASLDLISVPLVLVRKSDDVAMGVLRILPYPLPQGKEHYYPAATLDSDVLPGTGRTEADMQEYFAAQQRVVETSPQTVLSGGKIGRVAVSKDMRGQGCGRMLVLAAEAWMAHAVRDAPAARGAPHVVVRSSLSAQVVARAFYDNLGYKPSGDVYLEEGEPHIFYSKRVLVRPVDAAVQ